MCVYGSGTRLAGFPSGQSSKTSEEEEEFHRRKQRDTRTCRKWWAGHCLSLFFCLTFLVCCFQRQISIKISQTDRTTWWSLAASHQVHSGLFPIFGSQWWCAKNQHLPHLKYVQRLQNTLHCTLSFLSWPADLCAFLCYLDVWSGYIQCENHNFWY